MPFYPLLYINNNNLGLVYILCALLCALMGLCQKSTIKERISLPACFAESGILQKNGGTERSFLHLF